MESHQSIDINPVTLGELNTTEAVALHNLIDTLGSCGVGKIVQLPQIIVVGEQAAGKSSVLEALSRVRFPVSGGLCTRFATEIVLRRDPNTRVSASVHFDDPSKSTQSIDKSSSSEGDLPGIIEDAKAVMGITAENGNEFSKNVLRVEIQGPNLYPLTLVDLPGIYHVATKNQSDSGKETVNQVVDAYMAQANSIILVVLEANDQISKHVALERAMRFDPKRERTLGVITKPDSASRTEETDHIQLAKNQEAAHKLNLGWHVLKNNADGKGNDLDDRDREEAVFFEHGPWTTIVERDRGIAALRKKLSIVLYNQIRNRLPDVIKDIETKLQERNLDRQKYSDARPSPKAKRAFLFGMATDYQALMRDANNGNYGDAFFGTLEEPKNRLRAELKSFHRAFEHIIKTSGHDFAISPAATEDADQERHFPLTHSLAVFIEKHNYMLPPPTLESRKELNTTLERQAAENAGRELPGSYSSELPIQLFKRLSTPWKAISNQHIEKVLAFVKGFVEQLFQHVAGGDPGDATLEAIMGAFVDPFFEEREKALSLKVQEILEPFNEGYAVPMDAEFRQWKTDRLVRNWLAGPGRQLEASSNAEDMKTLTQDFITAVAKLNSPTKGGTFGTEEIMDMAQVYYEMSRRTFIDNIANLALEQCLIRKLLGILTTNDVDNMDDKALEEVAAESEDTKARRAKLDEEIQILTEGLATCKKWRPRQQLAAGIASPKHDTAISANPPATTTKARLRAIPPNATAGSNTISSASARPCTSKAEPANTTRITATELKPSSASTTGGPETTTAVSESGIAPGSLSTGANITEDSSGTATNTPKPTPTAAASGGSTGGFGGSSTTSNNSSTLGSRPPNLTSGSSTGEVGSSTGEFGSNTVRFGASSTGSNNGFGLFGSRTTIEQSGGLGVSSTGSKSGFRFSGRQATAEQSGGLGASSTGSNNSSGLFGSQTATEQSGGLGASLTDVRSDGSGSGRSLFGRLSNGNAK